MKLLILAGIIPFLFLGCAQPVPVSAALPCPDPLELTKAEPDVRAKINELRDSEDPADVAAYEFFLRRAAIQKARRARLQEICRSTWDE